MSNDHTYIYGEDVQEVLYFVYIVYTVEIGDLLDIQYG